MRVLAGVVVFAPFSQESSYIRAFWTGEHWNILGYSLAGKTCFEVTRFKSGHLHFETAPSCFLRTFHVYVRLEAWKASEWYRSWLTFSFLLLTVWVTVMPLLGLSLFQSTSNYLLMLSFNSTEAESEVWTLPRLLSKVVIHAESCSRWQCIMNQRCVGLWYKLPMLTLLFWLMKCRRAMTQQVLQGHQPSNVVKSTHDAYACCNQKTHIYILQSGRVSALSTATRGGNMYMHLEKYAPPPSGTAQQIDELLLVRFSTIPSE